MAPKLLACVKRVYFGALRFLNTAGRHAMTAYFLIFVVSLAAFDYREVVQEARAVTLSKLRPDFSALGRFAAGQQAITENELRRYAHYYESMIGFDPHKAESHAILGFCYYHLGRQDEALAAYHRAISGHRDFFWFPYNMGVIYFKQGRFSDALAMLLKAADTDMPRTVQLLTSSFLFLPILIKAEKNDHWMEERVDSAHRDCRTLIMLSYYHMKNFDKVRSVAASMIMNRDDSSFVYCYAGIAAYHLGEHDSALAFLQESIARDPHNAKAMQYIGLSLHALGREEAALSVLAAAAQLRGRAHEPEPRVEEITVRLF